MNDVGTPATAIARFGGDATVLRRRAVDLEVEELMELARDRDWDSVPSALGTVAGFGVIAALWQSDLPAPVVVTATLLCLGAVSVVTLHRSLAGSGWRDRCRRFGLDDDETRRLRRASLRVARRYVATGEHVHRSVALAVKEEGLRDVGGEP